MLRKTGSFCVAILLFLAAGEAVAGTLSVIGQSRWVEVGKVIDGDTFQTVTGEKIRLLGINAPEIAHHNRPGQPYGVAAKRALTELISGKTVHLKSDREKKDSYGRTLAQVYLRDGGWVNEAMVAGGLAYVYTFAPNFYWAEALLKAERRARITLAGIWKSEAFRIVDAEDISARHIGQFRIIRGTIRRVSSSRFQLGAVTVTIPRSAQIWFSKTRLPADHQQVIVRGRIRTASGGGLFLALHSPHDLE